MPDEQTHDEREQRRDGRGRDRVRVEDLEQLNVRRDDGDEVAAVEPRFPSEKVREIDLRERAPELVIARTRLAHQQIVAHRTLEEVALVADVGDAPHQARLLNVAQLRAADGHRAGVALVPAHQKCGDRRLAAARLADERDEFALRDRQIDAVQNFALRFVGKAQAAADNVARGTADAAVCGLGQVEQAENLIARGHAVHGNMEKRAELAHGDEKVRRQQDDEQRARKVDLPRAQLRCGHDDAERRAAVGDEVHDRDGVELHRKNLHRDLAELFGLDVHLIIFEGVGLIDFQGRQALQIFKKRVAERRVLPPVFREQLLRPCLYRRDGDGDERHADEQHDRRRHAHEAQHDKKRQRREHRVEKLRQIRAEVRFELVDALDRDLHDLRRFDLLGIRRAEAQELVIDRAAQRLLDRLGR